MKIDLKMNGFLIERPTNNSTKIFVYKIIDINDDIVKFETESTKDIFEKSRTNIDYTINNSSYYDYTFVTDEIELLAIKLKG